MKSHSKQMSPKSPKNEILCKSYWEKESPTTFIPDQQEHSQGGGHPTSEYKRVQSKEPPPLKLQEDERMYHIGTGKS